MNNTMNSKKTIEYYNEKAEDFNEGIRAVDFRATQKHFLRIYSLAEGYRIMDTAPDGMRNIS